MGLLIQLQTAHQQQVEPSLPPLIQAMVESGLQTEKFLRILSGITVQFQVFYQHGAGGRLQQGKKLRAEYDFTDAYNGGNSLKFSGDVAGKTDQDVRLYSTKLEVTEKTKLRVAHKGGKGSKVYMAFSTTPDYKFDDADAWKELTFLTTGQMKNLISAHQQVKPFYAVKLFFEHEGAVKDYQFNLGQLTITDNHQAPQAPTSFSVVKQSLKNAQEAEAVVQFAGNQDADFYEVYEKDGNNWRLLTGSSASTIYFAKSQPLC